MANEEKTKLRLEIAHVLFIDIVGYSKLLINEQSERLQTLKEIVRGTEQFEVKHGVRVGLVNLYLDEIGNPQVPKKLQILRKHRARTRWTIIAISFLLLAGIVALVLFLLRRPTQWTLSAPEKSIAVLPF